MGTFSYTSGNPANLVGGHAASMSDISGPFSDIATFLNGNIAADNLASGAVDVAELATALATYLGVTQSGAVRRGKSIIATEESRSSTSYGTLTTPDRVQNIVLPTDGIICAMYHAMWKCSVAGAARAALFVGSDELVGATYTDATPQVVNATHGHATAATYQLLSTDRVGLTSFAKFDSAQSNPPAYTGDASTPQMIGSGAYQWAYKDGAASQTQLMVANTPVYIMASAGTYDVSVQFKSTSGSVTAKGRKLWVWTMGF